MSQILEIGSMLALPVPVVAVLGKCYLGIGCQAAGIAMLTTGAVVILTSLRRPSAFVESTSDDGDP